MRGKSLAFATVGLLSTAFLVGAPEARAGDDFERGFKNELGRLAAREVVHAGRIFVGGVLLGRRPTRAVDYRAYRYREHRDAVRDRRPRRAFRPRAVVYEQHYYYGVPCERRDTRRRSGYYRD
jgi:hypothetical protein